MRVRNLLKVKSKKIFSPYNESSKPPKNESKKKI